MIYFSGHVQRGSIIIQAVPRLSPNGSWNQIKHPCEPGLDEVGTENGWMFSAVVPF